MKAYLDAVRRMVDEKFRQGKPDEIRAELRRLRRKFKPEKQGLVEAKKIVKLVEKDFENDFILRYTKDFASEQFENLSDRFDKGVLDAVRRSMKSPNASEEAEKQIKRLGTTQERFLRNVLQTAKGGIAQARKIEDASKAGMKYFRYDGPIGGSRAFCSARVGKIFSIEEIEAMEGQAGLPVLYFGGGWNCRHRWVAVDENKALLERLDPDDVKWRAKDLREDIRDHLKDFEGLTAEQYQKQAENIVKSKSDPYMQIHKGKKQFVFWASENYAVADIDGTIRGHYITNDIEKTKKAYKEKKQCKKII